MIENPPVPLGPEPSFGFGDRLGCAAPGHLAALAAHGGPIRGVFAQQSIREMERTRRTPRNVMEAAAAALAAAGHAGPWGADGDHLKTADHVERVLEAGFTLFTLDPSDHVDSLAESYDPLTLQQRFHALRAEVGWAEAYMGQEVHLDDGTRIFLDAETVRRGAVKYGRAVNHAVELAAWIRNACAERGQDHEIELSVDETGVPTTPAEHYLIADRCLGAGVKLASLAPRFPGRWEKGVDFIGDPAELEASFRIHAAVARSLGAYKLSLHSGSDKLSAYPALAGATRGRFHVKTAGTSFLEALRVVLHRDEALFREIVTFARDRYPRERATYCVHADLDRVPPPEALPGAAALEKVYLDRWEDTPPGRGFTAEGRQILHCTYGAILTHGRLGPALHAVLDAERRLYAEFLEEHFRRHLEALRAGM